MAKNDPKFVRLPERLVGGCLGDVDGSDFFIGGRDVQPFPDDDNPQAQNFVRDHLRRGNLEEASAKENDAVQEARQTMSDMHSRQLDERAEHDRAGHQEAQLQSLANKTQTKLDRLRRSNASDEEVDEEEEAQKDAEARERLEGKAPAGQKQGGSTATK